MVCWRVQLAVIVKTSTNVNPDAESNWKGFHDALLRPHSPMEVVVTNQGSEFKGVIEQMVEGMSTFQQVTNTERPWEDGPTERNNATIEEQFELARETFEPLTEAENDELGFGITPRMPRSLTNDDAMERGEVAEGPALDYQRAHDCRIAATTAFFKLEAKTGLQGPVRRVQWAGYRPKVGDGFMVDRYNKTSSRRLREGLAVVVLLSGSTWWATVLRSQTGDAQCGGGCCANMRNVEAMKSMLPHLREDLQRQRRRR